VDVDQFLKEGDALRFGPHVLEVLHTPGHSPGSLSLHLPGEHQKIFSGDTLFQGSIGRTDLWGGSYEEILRSIHNRLLIFPDETPVFPGHGPPTAFCKGIGSSAGAILNFRFWIDPAQERG
jgi:glyoxylase-like metal-dependent hydrolase (beta-lactamase superfamily II)